MKRILVKKPILALCCLLLLITSHSQKNYWQQEVNYTIDVSLNDKDHVLNGFEKIEYINHSPDTLLFIWFHIWPNAYKNDKTAFSDQLLENGNTKFYFSDKEQKGYINRLDFKVNNITAQTKDHPNYIDIIKLILPSPLPPGQKILITTPFYEKLPYNFSRGGHDGQSYQVTQWYPKPAVYDNKGWHPMPYLDQGEFYSEFGSFDVSITVPENYVVAATGELQNAEEKEWLKTRSSFTWQPVKRKVKTKSGSFKTISDPFPPSSADIKTLRFKQNAIHDFAWFADKRFIVNHDTCQLASGRVIDVFTYYTPPQKEVWHSSVLFAKDAIHHYSSLVGEYPYNIVSAVQGPESFGGGMEYPTITIISPENTPRQLDYTLAHEIGHNWFYGILASNERDHPWMDEGINSYYEAAYSLKKNDHFNQHAEQKELDTYIAEKTDQPIETGSAAFSEANYNAIAYYKTSKWMEWLRSCLGTATFNKAMQEYYRQWQFKHPQPEDFKKVMEEASSKNLDSAFSLLNQKGELPGHERKGLAVWNPAGARLGGYDNKKSVITILPALGFNSYDKLMAGAFITNLRKPINRLQFFLAPMYGTSSKKFTGIGFVNHSFYTAGFPGKIDIGISGSTFTMDRYQDTLGSKVFMSFQKIVPGIRLTFKEKNPRSTFLKYLQFKTYMIHEDLLRFRGDSLFTSTDTVVRYLPYTTRNSRTLNQLLLVVENYRALYPYRAELKAEQGKGFIRLAFTGDYFFNYSKNEGGVDVRLFAGKFLYTDRAKADPYLYTLNLSAPKGNLDYTYSDYFIGRNDYPFRSESVKWTIPYQQIMIRDGAFKVNTDGQGNIGASDEWLMATNFSFDIPASINPLDLLPFKVNFPLKAFVDIGTYGETWKKGAATDRFLYDAGIQLALLKGLLNIYVPILYSKPFKDYYATDFFSGGKNRFLKTISFSIDISKFNSKRFTKGLPF
ncbi:MAG: M1 family metallopeptidase [Bacteroidota bacterium]|nr:M1 family metallopeptidase [Bacteroidota bacterium]